MNAFKIRRENTGLSRKDAANQLNISWFHLRNIENNQRAPRVPLLLKMSRLYDCELTELLEESEKILQSNYSKRAV